MFTNTQIEEIRKKLLLKGVKDTQFPSADSLKGDETVAIVQQGINKQLGLKILLESVTKWSVSDFLNISKSNEDSYIIEEVLKLVTPINRKAGQVITFKDKRTGTWSIYQFKGKSAEDWFNLDYWDDILAKVDNHFKGLILNECILNTEYPRPIVGDFAFVGSNLEEAVLYTCYNYGYWHNTEEPALDINDELKIIVEEIFNNVEKYPELVQSITSIAPVYTLDYNNINQESFVELTNAINENKIITLNNLPYVNFDRNNIFIPTEVSDNNIILSTSKFVDVYSPIVYDKKSVSISTLKVTINSDGTNQIELDDIVISRTGNGDKFLSDNGTYKSINITPQDFRTKVDITGVVMGISGQMNAETVTINKNIYNDLISNGGNTLFCYIYMDHTAFTQYNSANVPYCVGGDSDGMFICFNCMITSGFKTVKCRLTQTAITFDSVVS